MTNVFFLHPKQPQTWHGLYFITFHDPDSMTEDQAADKLRHLAIAITRQFPGLELDLDEASLNLH
ncbi:MAG TPA: hypothetical protein VHC22_19275 [Pirellulales bacterium]|nr:hypothetical protein [Pirellulales bacterium]